MKKYQCYIKSHCELPDFEVEVEAKNKKEAIDKIRGMLKGEWEEDFLKEFIKEKKE
ncbi:MAG: hypothetical protein ABIN00_08165 [candidate division WOR-3 bacterium]